MCFHWSSCTNTVMPIRKKTAKVGYRCTEPQSSRMSKCWTASSWVRAECKQMSGKQLDMLMRHLLCIFFSWIASYELSMEGMTADGDTALTLACQAGHVENVKVLLQHGASPHNMNSRNETPLLLGITTKQHQIIIKWVLPFVGVSISSYIFISSLGNKLINFIFCPKIIIIINK